MDTPLLYFCRYAACDEYIAKLEDGQLQAQPGCTEEETLEVNNLPPKKQVHEMLSCVHMYYTVQTTKLKY